MPKGQHGFKKGTASAGLLLQSLIARALDDGEFVAMARLDLSSAFDVVDVPLLIKRLKISDRLSFFNLLMTRSSLSDLNRFLLSVQKRNRKR